MTGDVLSPRWSSLFLLVGGEWLFTLLAGSLWMSWNFTRKTATTESFFEVSSVLYLGVGAHGIIRLVSRWAWWGYGGCLSRRATLGPPVNVNTSLDSIAKTRYLSCYIVSLMRLDTSFGSVSRTISSALRSKYPPVHTKLSFQLQAAPNNDNSNPILPPRSQWSNSVRLSPDLDLQN